MEDKVTRDNLYEVNHLAPSGFQFSAKKLTEKANKKLKGYWLCTVNYNEKVQEIADDRKKGFEITSFDYKWQGNYANSQTTCLLYLKHNGFLKKQK